MIYLDNAATTPIKDEVLEAMMPYLKGDFGNASSPYALGMASRKAIDHAREQIASVIGARPEEIFFTSGGTESNNWALRDHTMVLTTEIEHPSITNETIQRPIDVDTEGLVNIDQLKAALGLDWDLVSIQFANNEIGTIQSIEEIGKLCRYYEVHFHTDAVQAFGHVPIDVERMRIDMLSASGHKFGAPKGIGFLYVRKGIHIKPFICGGHQENGLRAGTENVAGIVGMGVAAEIANKTMEARISKERTLQTLVIGRLTKEIPGARVNGATDEKCRLSNNISLTIDGVSGETLVLLLDNMGICISAGSACTSDSPEPSRVLKAIGLTNEQALSTIRITLSDTTRVQEAHYTVDAIKKCVSRLRGI